MNMMWVIVLMKIRIMRMAMMMICKEVDDEEEDKEERVK